MIESEPKSEKSKFLDDCYARVWKGDMTVFEECFTPDFRLTMPETKLMSPSGSLHGKFALETLSRYLRADGLSWRSVKEDVVCEIESDSRIMRESRWVAENPFRPYAGFAVLPPDLEVTIRIVQIFTFRGGKICDQFSVYDHLGYYFDMAEGDLDRAAEAIKNVSVWFKAQREAVAKRELPIPDPGEVYQGEAGERWGRSDA